MKFSTGSEESVSTAAVDGQFERQALELAAARAGLRGERARELALGLRQNPSRPRPVGEAQLAPKRRRRPSAA